MPVSQKPRWLPKALAAAVLVLLLGGGYAGYHWYSVRTGPGAVATSTKPSIAVLPLKNLSGDSANEYFSDGMTEEINSKLSHIQGVTVTPYGAAAHLKLAEMRLPEIGRELQARYLLQGSVWKSADQVRVNVQLVESSTGSQVWADDFTGNVKDVFGMQEQTALSIASALKLKLGPQEEQALAHRSTQNPQAYDAYLRGHDILYNDPTIAANLERARGHFENALKADPNYALALAGLSWVDGETYRNVESRPELLQRAEQLAQRALAIDPALSEAHLAMGTVYANKYDYVRASGEFREALRSTPDSHYAWDLLSWSLAYQQPPDALGAEAASRQAIKLRASAAAYYHLGRALLFQQRYPEAIAAFEHGRDLSPSSTFSYLGLGQVYLAQGDYDRAITALLKTENGSAINVYWLGAAYAARGDKEKALATLQKALAAGYSDFTALDASPYFVGLRSDPRFQQLMKSYRK